MEVIDKENCLSSFVSIQFNSVLAIVTNGATLDLRQHKDRIFNIENCD